MNSSFSPLSRRTFLRGAGVALALPWLESMVPARAATGPAAVPHRVVAIETNMGILPQFFFPDRPGRDYALTPYLQKLARVRDKLTVLSGVSHPGVTGAHAAEKCFLTGTPHPERGGFRNGISLDQLMAERHRQPDSLSVTRPGHEQREQPDVELHAQRRPIPAERSPNRLFRRLFFKAGPKTLPPTSKPCGRNAPCSTSSPTRPALNQSLSRADQLRMDQYLTSVRNSNSGCTALNNGNTAPGRA